MKTIPKVFSALAALISLLFWTAQSSGLAADSSGFKPLFNGKDFTGWQLPEPNPFWTVADGVIVGVNDEKNKGHLLLTKEEYKDFILESEARWTGEIDSGFFFREPELQLQLGVSRSLKTDMTCCFYTGGKEKYPMAGRAQGLDQIFKPGEWNHYRIEAKGDTFTVWLNGKKVTEYTDGKYSKPGPIGLQIHPGLPMKVEFRNIRLKPL